MAGIDASIYQNAQTPNFLGSIQQGLSLRDSIDQRAQRQKAIDKENAIKEAYNAGLVKNPDGSVTYDQNKTLGAMANVGGQEYLQTKQQMAAQDAATQKAQFDKKMQEINLIGQFAGASTDQASYSNNLAQAKALGIDVSSMPQTFDPSFTRSLQARAMSAKEQLAAQMEQQSKAFDQGMKREEMGLRREELGIKRAEANAKGANGEKLPLDQKKMVEGLATKNSTKLAIKNQIDSVMSNWDNLSEDQKVATGRSLLKTLNSTEGADAIGAEEAKRLGSKLEFAMGNLTNSNPIQWGRDLEGFKKQAMNTSSGIQGAIDSNQGEIDRLMGRPTDPIRKSSSGSAKPSWAL